MLGMVTGLASSAHAAAKQQKSRAIAVVFDNSGSMYGSGNYNWCRATYAMEVFAAMMNEGDVLLVYPMHDVQLKATGNKISSLTIKGPGDASTIRDIYTPSAGGTPFNPVEDAYNALKKTSADEKYLIVITDGQFEGSRLDDGTTIFSINDVNQYLNRCANDMNVMFLGIGISDYYMPTVSNSATQYYTKAHSSGEVLDKLTAMCNRIFGRDQLDVNGDRITFDVSMGKIIVFVQGKGIENVSLSGGTKVSEHATKYSEYGSSGVSPVDTSLQGMLVTYENLDAGTYSISYTGDADNVCVYYEPDVDLVIQLVNSDGIVVDPSGGELYAGSYRLEYGLVDKYGNFTNSDLLGTTSYDITYSIDGVPHTETAGSSGSVDIELAPGSTLDGEFIVQYLKDYTIYKDGKALGWPDGGLNIVPRPVGTVEIQVSGGLDSYNLSSLEQDAVYNVSVYYDGKPVTGGELDRTDLNAELTGGNAKARVQRTDSGYTVTVSYNGDAASTDCGEYTLTLSATYTLDQTGQSPDTVKTFSIVDDAKALAAEIELVQSYYLIKDIPSSEPIYVNLTAAGAPLAPDAFNTTSIGMDIPGVEFDVTPDAANSRYIIHLKDNGQIEPGAITITAIVNGIDEVGRPVTAQDTARIELQPYPKWMIYLFWILVALLILTLIWLYLNAKILPKHISVGPCTFIVDGDIVTGTAKCVYTGKNKRRGTLTVQSPHYGANPAAKCGYTLELEAISPRRTRSSARSVQVVAVRPMSASSTIAVQIGGCNLSKDPISGKLMKAGGKPGAPLSFKIGNKAKTSVTAEVMDMANGGGEVTVSMSVPLKFL